MTQNETTLIPAPGSGEKLNKKAKVLVIEKGRVQFIPPFITKNRMKFKNMGMIEKNVPFLGKVSQSVVSQNRYMENKQLKNIQTSVSSNNCPILDGD